MSKQSTTTERKGINLDDLIPSSSVADRYIGRRIEGFREFDVYEAAMASGHNVMLTGPTGSGKTMSVRAFAAHRGLPFYTINVNGAMDMTTIFGGWVPTADGSLEFHDGVATTMVHEQRGILLWDEINMGTERNLAKAYNLFDERREITLQEHKGEVLSAPAGCDFLIVAAYNPGYRGSRELSQALPNRFAFKLEFSYDPTIESQLVVSESLLELAGKLRRMDKEIKTPVSTNMQIEFCEIAMAFDVPFAIKNFLQAFPAHERESVTNVFNLYKTRISHEIDQALAELDEEGEQS